MSPEPSQWRDPNPIKRVLAIVAVICAGGVVAALLLYNKPAATGPFAHLAPPCQLAAWSAPLDFPELSAEGKKDRRGKFEYLGECRAKKVTDVLWFVSGIHYNSWMKEVGRAPVRYEATVYENNDPKDLHVERHGTQYSICSVAAEGIDRTKLRYKRCGAGAYILEFKKLHTL
jgi:hypothetical protein